MLNEIYTQIEMMVGISADSHIAKSLGVTEAKVTAIRRTILKGDGGNIKTIVTGMIDNGKCTEAIHSATHGITRPIIERWRAEYSANNSAKPPTSEAKKNIWTPINLASLGTMIDTDLASIMNVAVSTVRRKRIKMQIKSTKLRDPNRSPWTKHTINLIGTMSDKSLAEKMNVKIHVVGDYRAQHNLPSFTANRQHDWTPQELALLGTRNDSQIARTMNVTDHIVINKRRELNIPHFRVNISDTLKDVAGTDTDENIANLYNISISKVKNIRREFKIDRFIENPWPDEKVALLGTNTDRAIAKVLGVPLASVATERRNRNIPCFARYKKIVWTKTMIKQLGAEADERVAYKLNTTVTTVAKKRMELNIRPFVLGTRRLGMTKIKWTANMIKLLGTDSDMRVGQCLGITNITVATKRRSLNIASFGSNTKRIQFNDDQMALIKNTKLSIYKVGNILDVSPMTIYNRRNAMLKKK
jgi:hypothetical protein